MPTVQEALRLIAEERSRDPLAPVTVVAPSHVAALQLRRRLAEQRDFAGVRFETLPRLAELLGAAELAAAGRSPLARPIGDYAAAQVAREAVGGLEGVRDLPGFARVLRRTFRRLRRAGFRRGEDVPVSLGSGHLGEGMRLYGRFRELTSKFYDDEDLMQAATAVVQRQPGLAGELGDIYVMPPGAQTADAEALLTALRRIAPRYVELDDDAATPAQRFLLASDPASEASGVVREVLQALESGLGLHEVAVLHGADTAYRGLLEQAFEAAGVPSVSMPGTPLSETAAGRGVLALANLPLLDYARTALLDLLSLAPLRSVLPAQGSTVTVQDSAWRRLAREAGVTHGRERWLGGLDSLLAERELALAKPDELSDSRRSLYESDQSQAGDLRGFIGGLSDRLEPLRAPQPAASFIEGFRTLVQDYLRADAPSLTEVLEEIDQLGTVDAMGGSFSLENFTAALRANLDLSAVRTRSLGDGVLIIDYRQAAGLSFRQVVLAGAYEGVLPAGVEAETLVEDRVWSQLRGRFPFVEDASLRRQRSQEAAERAVAAAGESLTWTAPLQAANAGRVYYPSQLMFRAAQTLDASLGSATELRQAHASAWLSRQSSPLAARLSGRVIDLAELRLRRTLLLRRSGAALEAGHPLVPAVRLLRARHGDGFSEFDGNVSALAGESLIPHSTVYPTALEAYATCGFRYFLGSVLHLRAPDDPEERDTIDPAERGSIVHEVLERFFTYQREHGRPLPFEPWNDGDRERLLALLDAHLATARQRGRTGLDVYIEHERRSLRADLTAFLDYDNEFRLSTGAVPQDFELRIPETVVGGLHVAGIADRVDRTPDGRQAWVIDYKTGRSDDYKDVSSLDNPLVGGTKLQLPVYLAAALHAEKAQALYWFISRRGEFKQTSYDDSPANKLRFEATLASILASMQAGVFPAVPGEENDYYNSFDNCAFCDFTRICSRRRDYEFAAKQDDPAMAPWALVAVTAKRETP